MLPTPRPGKGEGQQGTTWPPRTQERDEDCHSLVGLPPCATRPEGLPPQKPSPGPAASNKQRREQHLTPHVAAGRLPGDRHRPPYGAQLRPAHVTGNCFHLSVGRETFSSPPPHAPPQQGWGVGRPRTAPPLPCMSRERPPEAGPASTAETPTKANILPARGLREE